MRQYISIFVIAFILNVLWENAHALLYIHYKGAAITEFILFRAALFDAVMITLIAYIFLDLIKIRHGILIATCVLVLFSVGLEMWAIETGRWAYKVAMPIIPILGVGLTPTVQLGFLGYLSILIQRNLSYR